MRNDDVTPETGSGARQTHHSITPMNDQFNEANVDHGPAPLDRRKFLVTGLGLAAMPLLARAAAATDASDAQVGMPAKGELTINNFAFNRNRVRYSPRGLRILTSMTLGVLFSMSSIAFAADSLAWDKTFPPSDKLTVEKVSFYNRLGINLVGICISLKALIDQRNLPQSSLDTRSVA
jgi:hypothetical protein